MINTFTDMNLMLSNTLATYDQYNRQCKSVNMPNVQLKYGYHTVVMINLSYETRIFLMRIYVQTNVRMQPALVLWLDVIDFVTSEVSDPIISKLTPRSFYFYCEYLYNVIQIDQFFSYMHTIYCNSGASLNNTSFWVEKYFCEYAPKYRMIYFTFSCGIQQSYVNKELQYLSPNVMCYYCIYNQRSYYTHIHYAHGNCCYSISNKCISQTVPNVKYTNEIMKAKSCNHFEWHNIYCKANNHNFENANLFNEHGLYPNTAFMLYNYTYMSVENLNDIFKYRGHTFNIIRHFIKSMYIELWTQKVPYNLANMTLSNSRNKVKLNNLSQIRKCEIKKCHRAYANILYKYKHSIKSKPHIKQNIELDHTTECSMVDSYINAKLPVGRNTKSAMVYSGFPIDYEINVGIAAILMIKC